MDCALISRPILGQKTTGMAPYSRSPSDKPSKAVGCSTLTEWMFSIAMILALRSCVSVRLTVSVVSHLFGGRFPPQHHEVILHRTNFAQCRLQQILMQLWIACAIFENGPAVGLQPGINKHITVCMMQPV